MSSGNKKCTSPNVKYFVNLETAYIRYGSSILISSKRIKRKSAELSKLAQRRFKIKPIHFVQSSSEDNQLGTFKSRRQTEELQTDLIKNIIYILQRSFYKRKPVTINSRHSKIKNRE